MPARWGRRRHKLVTKAIERRLEKSPLYSTDGVANPRVIVKFFSPYTGWTWYATEGEKQADGDWLFFGLVHGDTKELGNFTLRELGDAYRAGVPLVERDCHFGNHKLKEFMS
jgi:hypothetical protein